MADDKKAAAEDSDKEVVEGAGAEGAEGTEGGGSRKKILLFVLIPIVLILIGAGAAYQFGLLDKFIPGHSKPSCETIKEGDEGFAACKAAKSETAPLPGVFEDVPPMIVNLNSTGKQARYLKVSLKIELDDLPQKDKLEAVMPRVIDQFQMYLRELRIEDLRGTAGIYRMKIELLSRIRAAAPDVKIRDVLFQEILVQ
jgi:flagellar FliL protein